MNILQSREFKNSVKKLHNNQKKFVDDAVKDIIANPQIGELKSGDLSGIRVYKFDMINQLMLLAYSFNNKTITLNLLLLGSHENFYRDLKN